MMKLPHSPGFLALPLPILLIAAAPAASQAAGTEGAAARASARAARVPASATRIVDERASAPLSASASWEKMLARRSYARALSGQGRWAAASSAWRDVMLDLKRIQNAQRAAPEAFDAARARSVSLGINREAEREVKRAQSHLGSFWRVRDVFTPGVDSRNPAPQMAAADLSPEPPPLARAAENLRPARSASVVASASMASMGVNLSASKPRPAPRVASTIFGAAQGEDGRGLASMRWARSQWWARPMVQRGIDSRNPAALALPVALAPRLAPTATPASAAALMRPSWARSVLAPVVPDAALNLAAERLTPNLSNPAAPAATVPESVPSVASGASTRRKPLSWTVQLKLPSAPEAALAASRPLKSQP